MRFFTQRQGGKPDSHGMDADLVRIRFQFVGQVQAVGFRWNTNNLAREAGATGWVRNEPDGSVIAEIQGAPGQVEAVVDGLDAYYNGSTWSGGFQIARREYLPVVSGEATFRTIFH
jgi:acylphosphatase